MDTKKLRQKILDLAIRGKLVPQDPNDEPASVLLERIRTEKERLIKEGKIKRSKKTVSDDEIEAPFEIPESWEWVRLDALSDIKGGKRIPHGMDFSKVPTEHVYLRVTNMKCHTIIENEIKYIDEEVFQIIKNYTISSDDLYLTIAGTIGDVGLIPPKFSNMNLTENAAKLTNLLCDKQFLMYALLSTFVQNHFSSRFHQVAQPKLSIETASSAIIALPPLAEQKRIANEVERWFTLIDELESNEGDLLKAIDKAKSKILDLAIHGKLVPQDPNDEPAIELLKRINPKFESCDEKDSLTLPTSWQLCSVKDVFQINPKTNASDSLDAAFVPMSSIEDQYNNKFVFETKKWGVIKRGYTHFQDGDIAVAKISPCLENRKSVVLKDMPNGIGAGTTELNVFRSEIVNPVYGLFFFKSNLFISRCVGTFNGVVGQQRVATKIIEDIDFPLPPLSEQKRIVAKIEDLFAVLDSIKDSLEN